MRRSIAYDWFKSHGLTCEDPIKALPLATPLCVSTRTPVPSLLQTLMRSGVSKAVVVDDQQQLRGMVTIFDLLKKAG